MTMITPSYLGETIEYSSLHACRSTLEDPTYHPDVTILMYNRGDATENVRKPTDFACEPRPYFYIDSNGKLRQDDAVLGVYGKALQTNAVLDFLRRNSRIYGVLSQANLNLSIHEPLYRKLRGWFLAPWTPRLPKLKPGQAPYAPQDSWTVTSALVERLNADCLKTGSKLVVVEFPNIVKDAELNRQIVALGQLSAKDRFGSLDLTPVFRWNPDPMSLFLQYHFSIKGHKLVAEQISKYLDQSNR